jgi:chemotaxis signal transduction protein/hemoglobin-like flavoprotein
VDKQHANRQLVVTRVGSTLCGIDIDQVHEIIPVPAITSVPKSPVNMLGVINVRSVVIPVADLRSCLGFPPSPFTQDTRIVLVNYHSEKIGLVVDAVSEVTTLPADDFQTLANSHGDSVFLRAVARFQGRLVLEIDHTRVVDERLNVEASHGADAERELERAAEEALQAQAPTPDDNASTEEGDDGSLRVDLLETSYALLAPNAERLAERFYERLFQTAPAVRALFPDDMKGQRRALLAAIGTIIGHLREPEKLTAYVGGLGARHVAYGAQPEHYDVVASVLIDTMAELAGDRWNSALATAWARALSAVKDLMLAGAAERELQAAA